MKKLSVKDFLSKINKIIIDFENDKANVDNKTLGAIYTPKPIVDYMVLKVFKLFFKEFYNLPKFSTKDSFFTNLQRYLYKSNYLEKDLIKKLKTIKILDPACGSGRFLLSTAEKLYEYYKTLNSGLDNFKIKSNILKENLYGIEIEKSAYIITKLRLISWLFSDNTMNLKLPDINMDNLLLEEIEKIIHSFNIKLNLFNLDFLLEFDFEMFDIIVGNPPYIENKKIKDAEFKKKLTKRFKSAYRLFDLSVLFIEKSLELLKEQDGCLSMITTNKFLAADYGIRIRELLVNNTELKEITNISSLPIFGKTATYPIIISFKKSLPKADNTVVIKKYENLNEIFEDSNIKSQYLPQKLIKKIPASVFPVSGQINLINFLYNNFKTFAESFSDLKIKYRPYGFLNWSKHLDNISNIPGSKRDLLLIGTGNAGKYHIKFDKPIKIAKKNIPISYFKYKSEFEHIWREISSQKLIFREIAKDLTWVYDPGIYTNVTGLYFVIIPSLNQEKLFVLLAIMNSTLMDLIFKTLFSSLHMSGGYLRFNGSFIRRLPIPQTLPLTLSYFGKILHLLSQLQYDMQTEYTFKPFNLNLIKIKSQDEITSLIHTCNKITNSLVSLLYLDNYYLELNKDFNMLREFLFDKENWVKSIQIKHLLPRYQIENYKMYTAEELDLTLIEIKNFLNRILENKILLNQIDEIMGLDFTERDKP
jgi:tRNA1(Val) A37 N6-methylase TrmN6